KKPASGDVDAEVAALAEKHPQLERRVLEETARLHEGDEENLRLWREFMPACLSALRPIYDRLGVRFDYELGESFYHDRLAAVVADLQAKGIAQVSEGAVCVFIEGFEAPMIIR